MPKIGINLNNREPLLLEDYSVDDMFNMGERAEELGFDSIWVGDNLLEKPRLEPLSCLAKIAGITESVKLGTACMVTSLRHPVQFAQAWATLDMISEGRTILGACMGEPTDENRHQHKLIGFDPRRRSTIFEEGIEIMRELWRTGSVTYSGDYFEISRASFNTGKEITPLAPVQDDPPIHIVSNPSVHGKEAVINRAVKRIVEIGGGWMTCCRADRPQEYEEQLNAIAAYAEQVDADPDEIDTSYQVTINIADSQAEGRRQMRDYLTTYYPQHDIGEEGLIDGMGPIGPAEDVIKWIDEFHRIGCDHFIIRFGAYDQLGQLDRFAEEILPSF